MAATIKFELVSPERILLAMDAEQVELPGTDGDMTVLAGHAPITAALRPGTIRARSKDGIKSVFVKSGFVEVRADSIVVLADSAFISDEVDPRQIERELEASQTALNAATDDEARRHLNMAIEEMRAISATRSRG